MIDSPKRNTERLEYLRRASLFDSNWSSIPIHDYGDDMLSGLLMPMRLEGTVAAFGTFEGSWGFDFSATNRFIHYTVVGRPTIVEVKNIGQYILHSGDIAVLPHGSAHRIRDAETKRCVPAQLPGPQANGGFFGQQVYRLDERGRFIHGSVETNEKMIVDGSTSISLAVSGFKAGSIKALLKFLPPVIHVPGKGGMFPDWVIPLARLVSLELEQVRPGGAAMIQRLTEVFFMQAVLAYFDQVGRNAAGRDMLTRSQGIREMLGSMHRHPEKSCTTASMAREVGMSRATFAATFKRIVGEGPMTYLRHLRLERSAELLRSGLYIDDVAARVGYQSKLAFERAFKRKYAVSPATYKRTCLNSDRP